MRLYSLQVFINSWGHFALFSHPNTEDDHPSNATRLFSRAIQLSFRNLCSQMNCEPALNCQIDGWIGEREQVPRNCLQNAVFWNKCRHGWINCVKEKHVLYFYICICECQQLLFFCLSGSVGCGEGAVTAYKKIYIYSRMSYIQTKLFIKVLVLPVPSLKMLQRDNLYVYENLSQRQFKLVLFTIQNIYYANFPRIFQNGC